MTNIFIFSLKFINIGK